jgi:hypothetical protein
MSLRSTGHWWYELWKHSYTMHIVFSRMRTSFKYSCKINGAFCYMTTWWCNSNLWASIVLNVGCMHMLHRLNTCTGIRLEIKFHPVSVDVVGLDCHLAGMHNLLCCLCTRVALCWTCIYFSVSIKPRKLVIPNMIEMLMRQWCEHKP